MTYRYEIKENNEVLVFQDEDLVPFISQPHNGFGQAWSDKAEAEAWVISFIDELTESDTKVAIVVEETPEA